MAMRWVLVVSWIVLLLLLLSLLLPSVVIISDQHFPSDDIVDVVTLGRNFTGHEVDEAAQIRGGRVLTFQQLDAFNLRNTSVQMQKELQTSTPAEHAAPTARGTRVQHHNKLNSHHLAKSFKVPLQVLFGTFTRNIRYEQMARGVIFSWGLLTLAILNKL